MAHNIARNGASVLFFSLEMSREELAQRYLARYTGIATGHQLREGALRPQDFRKLVQSRADMSDIKLAIDDSGALAAHQIRARARRHKRKHGLDMVVIDYLNLMTMDTMYRNKVDQIGEVTKALKAMAKDLRVPVVLLAELNRSVESREDKRPHLSNLRDSGAIEEHSDAVMFLYRDQYYLERDEPKQKSNETDVRYEERRTQYLKRLDKAQGIADVIVAKWRQGQIGTIKLRFHGGRQVFTDIDTSIGRGSMDSVMRSRFGLSPSVSGG